MKSRNGKVINPAASGFAISFVSMFLTACLLGFLGAFGDAIGKFILGVFGLASYAVILGMMLAGVTLIFGGTINVAPIKILKYILIFFVVVCTFQIVSSKQFFGTDIGTYLVDCYNSADTAGGILAGIIVYYFAALLSYGVALALFIVAFLALTAKAVFSDIKITQKIKEKSAGNADFIKANKKKGPHIVDFSASNFSVKNDNSMFIEPIIQDKGADRKSKTPESVEYSSLLPPETPDERRSRVFSDILNIKNDTALKNEEIITGPAENEDVTAKNGLSLIYDANENTYTNQYRKDLYKKNKLDKPEEKRFEEKKIEFKELKPLEDIESPKQTRKFNFPERQPIIKPRTVEEEIEKAAAEEPAFKEIKSTSSVSTYLRPPVHLLKDYRPPVHHENVNEKAMLLENALSSFDIDAKVVGYTEGPSFVRYELQIPPGISVKKISNFDLDLQSVLQVDQPVGIEAPIPGKNAVGIELPKDERTTIGMKAMVEDPQFMSQKLSPISFCLGQDIGGKKYYYDIKNAPHLLIAGASGSGKSICLHLLLTSILFRWSPDDVRLILVDPKRVEFALYRNLPHLLIKDIIAESEHAIKALDWCIVEMERRYELLMNAGCTNITNYNEYAEKNKIDKIPYILFVIDELADLMSVAKKALEARIVRLAQKARASGIHLVFATQRPSIDVVTGTIKANFPSRIIFKVSSVDDSRVALGGKGAEKLLGKGDMLFNPVDAPVPLRLQGAFMSNEEVADIVRFVKENNESKYDVAIEEKIFHVEPEKTKAEDDDDKDDNNYSMDPYLPDVLRYCFKNKKKQVSTSMIQVNFRVGYTRAARIIAEMENAGFVSAADGNNKPRDILITEDEFIAHFGDNNNDKA